MSRFLLLYIKLRAPDALRRRDDTTSLFLTVLHHISRMMSLLNHACDRCRSRKIKCSEYRRITILLHVIAGLT